MKEYEVCEVVTLRFAASCRSESVMRSRSLALLFDKMALVLLARGVEMRVERRSAPLLVERERAARVSPDEEVLASGATMR